MKKILIFTILLSSFVLSLGMFHPVSAYDCPVYDENGYQVLEKNGEPKVIKTSFEFNCPSNNKEPIAGIILTAINILSATVGIAVVAGIVWAGLKYSAAGGDASKTKEAKDMIFNAIIALFLFIFLFAGANFLVPGGLFN